MRLQTKLLVTTLLISTLAPAAARAGGIELYEIGTPDIGLASAGYAARAEDASTLFKNPAGMSLLQSSQFQGGVQMLYGSVSFSPNGATSPRLGGNDGGNAVGALPAASGFFVYDISDRWKVGLGAFNYFGLAEHYDDNWVGRYYVRNGALIGMSLMPAVSFKATDWLSLGAGLNAMYGYLDTKLAINNRTPFDGELHLHDETWGFGGNAGILLTPREGTRIGITYLSQVKLGFNATPSISVIGSGGGLPFFTPNLDLATTVPQSAMIGFYQDLTPKWAVMGDFGWQNWKHFGEVQVGVDTVLGSPRVVTANLNYQDTWHGALGAQYRPCDKWQFTGGAAFDSSAVNSANRTVTLPMGQAWRFGVGASYQLSHAVNINAAYEFMWCGDMAVTQGSATSARGLVSGSYNDAWFSFVTLNLTWVF
ncbi:MAG TPA: outer membrane protein transport protein [Candidatus Acidoferrum sp.]|nr:outer membrane protein transport protein [Candidatus Acidoferrum sp.]